MFIIVLLHKVDDEEPPHFELQYVDPEKQSKEEEYSETTKYGSEAELRELLKWGGVASAEIDGYFEDAKGITDKFRCPEFVAADLQCIRTEGHEGACDSGLAQPPAKGADCECTICKRKFASIEDFDAHAPCPEA